jgi:hypothetical protein
MICQDFRGAEQAKLADLTLVFGSTSTWGVIPWLLLTCLSGKESMITQSQP